MVETIAPVVHGGRNRSYWTAIALHTLGATLSAALFGAFLGGLGHVLGAPWGDAGLIALAVVAGIYALRELFGLPIPLPDLDRQVPEWWRTFFSKNVAAFLYGIGLGIGFLTYLSFGTYVAVMTGAFISGDVRTGAVICAAFGLARAVSLVVPIPGDEPHADSKLMVLETLGGRATPSRTNAAALLLLLLSAVLAAF
jgi:hypothetical protein